MEEKERQIIINKIKFKGVVHVTVMLYNGQFIGLVFANKQRTARHVNDHKNLISAKKNKNKFLDYTVEAFGGIELVKKTEYM